MVVIIEDNWNLIKNVMLKHGWVDNRTLREETQITGSTISRILRSRINGGEVERQFINHNNSKTYGGSVKRYKFMWRLK